MIKFKVGECLECKYKDVKHDQYPCKLCLKAFDDGWELTHWSPVEKDSKPPVWKHSNNDVTVLPRDEQSDTASIILSNCQVDIYINKYYDSVSNRYEVDS